LLLNSLLIEPNPEIYERLITDDPFLNKLKTKLFNSKSLMLEGKLEGASMFRECCKIICNLLTITYQDDDVNEDDPEGEENNFLIKIQIFEKFCNFIDLAHVYMSILKQLLLDKNYSFLKDVRISF
jgi:hypothetical protein